MEKSSNGKWQWGGQYDRKLLFEDGSEYYGRGFGGKGDAACEIVFNTSMAGYQEIVSDPSYTDQAVVMSYPLIGNYGVAEEDFESKRIAISALIVRDINGHPSNFRSARTLPDLLEENEVPGICGVDTRKLVRSIRESGTRKVLLTDACTPVSEGIRILRESHFRHDAVKRSSCKKKWHSPTSNPRFHVAAIDCGMKSGIIRMLNRNKCNVSIVPYDTGYEEILFLAPDGLLLSNGPGDPLDVPEAIETVKALKGRVPIFGICLGHQIISLAYGAKTYKLKFGHRGGNHPVKELATGKIEMTSQNHSYAVEAASLAGTGLSVSHINLLDGTVEGVCSREDKVFSVQYHPESAPGPRDSGHLFSRFAAMMEASRRMQSK